MEKSIRLKQLIRFLKEHRAYKAWVRNVQKDCEKDKRSLHEKLKRINCYCCPLSCSFVYDETPEGPRFWCKLENEFYDKYLRCV
jgi:hypothetical protein